MSGSQKPKTAPSFGRMMRPAFPIVPMALLAASSVNLIPVASHADDWPQWLGPKRDGVWRETGIIDNFPPAGPRVLWRTLIGAGYSGPSVAAGRVYVMDRILDGGQAPGDGPKRRPPNGKERVLCLDASDGRILWEHAYDCNYGIAYSAGPRVTPTVDGDRVYTLGAEGSLICLEAMSGRVIWQRDLKTDYGVKSPIWGFAGHPLVDGEKLICLVGGDGSVAVAFDKKTGKEIWRALSAKEPGYCPPTMIEAGGKRQVIIWHPQALNSLDPETGAANWSEPFFARSGLTIAQPRQMGDLLFVTAFYNGPLMMRLAKDRPAASVAWRGKSDSEHQTDGLHAIICTPFLEDGHIYGVCSYGQLRCLRADTGERLWSTLEATTRNGEETRWANAFLIKQGDRFFLPNELGELIIARLTPSGYTEIGRAQLIGPTNPDPRRTVVWSHPAFANRRVYARNDREILCASLAKD